MGTRCQANCKTYRKIAEIIMLSSFCAGDSLITDSDEMEPSKDLKGGKSLEC